ncbi:MAG: hypothetical protein H6740_25445 [Alphaproteobacteria bacterium]|nr:hypothetical protein [Alphaproteobacteria bacterium]
MRALPLLAVLMGCTEPDPCAPDSSSSDSASGQDSPADSSGADDSGSADDSADTARGDSGDTAGDSTDCTPDDSAGDDSGGGGGGLSWPDGPTTLVWTRVLYDYNGITTEFSDLRVRVGEGVDCEIEQDVYTARLDASGGACNELMAEAQARVSAGAPGPVAELVLSFGDDDGNRIVPESGTHDWPDTDRTAPHLTAYGLWADWAEVVEALDCSANDPFSGLESWQNVNVPSARVEVTDSSADTRTLGVSAQLDGLGALTLDPTRVRVCSINLFE